MNSPTAQCAQVPLAKNGINILRLQTDFILRDIASVKRFEM
jgi:hypothetical protein